MQALHLPVAEQRADAARQIQTQAQAQAHTQTCEGPGGPPSRPRSPTSSHRSFSVWLSTRTCASGR